MAAFNRGKEGTYAGADRLQGAGVGGGSSAFMNRLKQQYSNNSSPGFAVPSVSRALPGQIRRTGGSSSSGGSGGGRTGTSGASLSTQDSNMPHGSSSSSSSSGSGSGSGSSSSSKVPGFVRTPLKNASVTAPAAGLISSNSSSYSISSGINDGGTHTNNGIINTFLTPSAKGFEQGTLSSSLASPPAAGAAVEGPGGSSMDMYFTNGVSNYRISQFRKVLDAENVDLSQLRTLAWNGVPQQFRPDVWQILLGYLPTNRERRAAAIARKRKEYFDSIPMFLYSNEDADRTTQDGENLRQIQVDLPRTSPDIAFFQQPLVQQAMERILYLWAIRHPASGYVQGMNDLLTPLLLMSLQRYTDNPLRCDVATLPPDTLANVEADAYWCLTKLLDNIQDHYTFSQPGLQRMMLRLEDLINRIDSDLFELLRRENVAFPVFSFRWMNCFLLRELPLCAIIRLWDTYFSEENGGFENFHVYVCAVLLKTFRDKLLSLDGFHEIIMFLQNPPTTDWEESQVEPILSQAYILSTLFDSSPSHLG